MNNLNFKKLFAEGFLIIFSVLFALFISRLSDDAKVRKQQQQALDKIHQEIQDNLKVIERWRENHGRLLARVDSVANGRFPTLRASLLDDDFFDFGKLSVDNSFIDAIVSETAWQAAKSTQIIAEFSYEDVEELTLLYGLQTIISDHSVPKIVDAIFSRESQDLKNLDATINQLNLLLQELVAQENVQLGLYNQRLSKN